MSRLKTPAKIILYRLAKKMNQKIWQIDSCVENRSRTKKEHNIDKQTLYRLMKKGLVARSNYKKGTLLNIYYLTEEGYKVAKTIVDEIDEYKRW